MANQTVTVAARIHARAETCDDVKNELLEMVAQTHQEKGCIAFDLHQSLDDPCQFLLSEMWASRQDLDHHLEKPYIKGFIEKADSLLIEPPDISLWKMISTPH